MISGSDGRGHTKAYQALLTELAAQKEVLQLQQTESYKNTEHIEFLSVEAEALKELTEKKQLEINKLKGILVDKCDEIKRLESQVEDTRIDHLAFEKIVADNEALTQKLKEKQKLFEALEIELRMIKEQKEDKVDYDEAKIKQIAELDIISSLKIARLEQEVENANEELKIKKIEITELKESVEKLSWDLKFSEEKRQEQVARSRQSEYRTLSRLEERTIDLYKTKDEKEMLSNLVEIHASRGDTLETELLESGEQYDESRALFESIVGTVETSHRSAKLSEKHLRRENELLQSKLNIRKMALKAVIAREKKKEKLSPFVNSLGTTGVWNTGNYQASPGSPAGNKTRLSQTMNDLQQSQELGMLIQQQQWDISDYAVRAQTAEDEKRLLRTQLVKTVSEVELKLSELERTRAPAATTTTTTTITMPPADGVSADILSSSSNSSEKVKDVNGSGKKKTATDTKSQSQKITKKEKRAEFQGAKEKMNIANTATAHILQSEHEHEHMENKTAPYNSEISANGRSLLHDDNTNTRSYSSNLLDGDSGGVRIKENFSASPSMSENIPEENLNPITALLDSFEDSRDISTYIADVTTVKDVFIRRYLSVCTKYLSISNVNTSLESSSNSHSSSQGERIDMDGCELTDEDLLSIIDMLRSMFISKVSVIDLHRNKLSGCGLRSIVVWLLSLSTAELLRTFPLVIDLTHNNRIRLADVSAAVSVLQESKQVELSHIVLDEMPRNFQSDDKVSPFKPVSILIYGKTVAANECESAVDHSNSQSLSLPGAPLLVKLNFLVLQTVPHRPLALGQRSKAETKVHKQLQIDPPLCDTDTTPLVANAMEADEREKFNSNIVIIPSNSLYEQD